MSSLFLGSVSDVPNFWLAEAGRAPIGPVNGQLLLEWREVGLVEPDALICEVGHNVWRQLDELGELLATARRPRTRFDPARERCMVDIEPLPPDIDPPPPEVDAPRREPISDEGQSEPVTPSVAARARSTPESVIPPSGNRTNARHAPSPQSGVSELAGGPSEITRVAVPRPVRSSTAGTSRRTR